jgi:hypothetical protein
VQTANQQARSDLKPAPMRRRFRIFDAMMLIGATALGCGAIEWVSRETVGTLSLWGFCAEVWKFLHQPLGKIGIWPVIYACAMFAVLISPIAATSTIALIPIRLIGPRPRWRRLACQPGVTSAWAAGTAMTGITILISGIALVCGFEVSSRWVLEIYFFSPMFIGLAVLASWMTLALGRRWRAERSWVDRFGRAAGFYWIMTGLLAIFAVVIQESDYAFTIQLTPYSAAPEEAASASDDAPSHSEPR